MAEELAKVVVTARPDAPPTGTVLPTPVGDKDRIVVAVPAWKLAYVRGVRSALQTLAVTFFGLLTGAPQAALVEGLRFFDLMVPEHKALLAIVTLIILPLISGIAAFLHNYTELKAKLDETMPTLRA